tara:strand:- start:244 stop:474 length:231 start_codon:yes stop_codon:yes gene_type:complete
MTYKEINKTQAINEGYRDLALAILQSGVKEDGEEYFFSPSGQLWKNTFITFDEGVNAYITDSPLARVELPNLTDED